MAYVVKMKEFEDEHQLYDHLNKMIDFGESPEVPLMDARGRSVLATLTAPGGDGWGVAYYAPDGEDGLPDVHKEEGYPGVIGLVNSYFQKTGYSPKAPFFGLVYEEILW